MRSPSSIASSRGTAATAVEPARRAEPVAASGGARAEARPARFEAARGRRASRSRARRATSRRSRRGGPQSAAARAEPPAEGGRGGWLSDLLGRASREDEPAQPAADERQTRRAMESLELPVGRYRAHDRS